MRLNPFLHPRTFLVQRLVQFRRWLVRRKVPVARSQILAALQAFGDLPAGILMVHSSLSACGQIEGGVDTVLSCLRQWTRSGTLVMPTHTYCYPKDGSVAPCFDPAETPSLVGKVTDAFWRQPGVLRSVHPTHSLACEGPAAHDLCFRHDWSDTACGPGTPYDRLVRQDCAVLLWGATFETYTLFHVAEHEAKVPYLYRSERCTLAYRDRADIEWHIAAQRHDMRIPRRFAILEGWLAERGLVNVEPLGSGQLRFVPSALALHLALMAELRKDPWFLTSRASSPC
jgi:aminoglycoside 3-N-acetyltransferase